MARISHKNWNAYKTARGANHQDLTVDLKKMAYDTLFDVSNSWGCAFGANLREAVYCNWWDNARQMLDVKPNSESKNSCSYSNPRP